MKEAGYEWDAEKKEPKKIEPKFHEGDTMRTWKEANDGYTDGMPVVVSIDDEFYHCTNELIPIKDQDDYEFPPINVKQKPDDKAESKFHEGNWYQCTKDFFGKGVTFDKNTAYYCAQEGCLQCEYGCHIAIVKDLYDNFKLWDISDAKDGDILVEDKIPSYRSSFIAIFKTKSSDYTFSTHCFIGLDGNFYEGRDEHYSENLHPATKEQRDLLFKKMREAGYEWDTEKKELKKIKEKPAEWSEEDERMYRGLHNLIYSTPYCDSRKEFSDWLESLKQRIGDNSLEKFKSLKHINKDLNKTLEDWGYAPNLYYFDGSWHVDWISCEEGDSIKDFTGDTAEEAINEAYNWFHSTFCNN